jgi:hypothetical protein
MTMSTEQCGLQCGVTVFVSSVDVNASSFNDSLDNGKGSIVRGPHKVVRRARRTMLEKKDRCVTVIM